MLKYLVIIWSLLFTLSCNQDIQKDAQHNNDEKLIEIKNENIIFEYDYDYLQSVYYNLDKMCVFCDPSIYTFTRLNGEDKLYDGIRIIVTKDKMLQYTYTKNNKEKLKREIFLFGAKYEKTDPFPKSEKLFFEINKNKSNEVENLSLKLEDDFLKKLNKELMKLDRILEKDKKKNETRVLKAYEVPEYYAKLNYMAQISLFGKKYTCSEEDIDVVKKDGSYLQIEKIKKMIQKYVEEKRN